MTENTYSVEHLSQVVDYLRKHGVYEIAISFDMRGTLSIYNDHHQLYLYTPEFKKGDAFPSDRKPPQVLRKETL